MAERTGIFFGAIQSAGLVPASVRAGGGGSGVDGSLLSSIPTAGGALEAAIRAGNVNTADTGDKEVLQLSESSRAAQEKHAHLLRRIEAERRARAIAVPTSVEQVVLRLRQLGEPVTLFGERPADRRERLRELLARLELEAEETGLVNEVLREIQEQVPALTDAGGAVVSQGAGPDTSGKPLEEQLFYIPIKNEALKSARADVFAFSKTKTAERLARERLAKHQSDAELEADRHAAKLYATAHKMTIVASQNGDVRPVASVRYAKDGAHVATGSWSSLVKVWDASSAEEVKVFRGHEDRVTGVAWHPTINFSQMSDDSDVACLCSASADGTARLWSAGRPDAVAVLKGHRARLSKVEFHPTGKFVGTTSFDQTWRLWDVATAQELLLQEGHYKEVYAISFQPDGALVATGDLHGNGRVWDLRSGRAIMPLQGHSKQILSMDFSVNGHVLASGSDDRTVRIWDLRQQKSVYVVPAHSGLVSEVRFSPQSGELLATASYDATLKLWRSRDWKLVATLAGHDGKVMAADFAPDERHLVSCGFDRTFKLWAHESEF